MAIRTHPRDVPRPKQGGLKFQTLENANPTRGTFLVYGRSGSGKTHFAGTFPKPLFLDMRGGLETVRKKKVAYLRPTTYLEMLEGAVPAHVKQFKTLVFDHMTEAGNLLMKEVLGDAKREIPQMQDWQLIIERMRRLLEAYVSDDLVDKHIVFCAEETYNKDELTGEILATISAPGKIREEAPTYFDFVFHLRNCFNPTTKTKGRWALTEPDGRHQDAKDRSGALDKLERPDFEGIWTKVCNAK